MSPLGVRPQTLPIEDVVNARQQTHHCVLDLHWRSHDASRTSVANRSSRWPLSRESSCSSWSVGSDPLEIRTAAGPSSAVQWVSIGGPYTVWSHARHVHVVWPPACPRHACGRPGLGSGL